MSAIANLIEEALKSAKKTLKPTIGEVLSKTGKTIDVPKSLTKTSELADVFERFGAGNIEHRMALAVKDKSPVGMASLRRGTEERVPIDPLIDVGKMTKHNPDTIYFGHNHPSGIAKFSQADVEGYKKINQFMEGSGYKYGGEVVSTPRQYAFTGKEGTIQERNFSAIRRNKDIPLDTFDIRIPSINIQNPKRLGSLNKIANGREGLFLIGKTKGAFLEASADEMATLRTGDKNTLFGKILRKSADVETLNIVPRFNEDTDMTKEALLNMKKFSSAAFKGSKYYIAGDEVLETPFKGIKETNFKALAPIGTGLAAAETFIQGNYERSKNVNRI
jgi:hypothetical protein